MHPSPEWRPLIQVEPAPRAPREARRAAAPALEAAGLAPDDVADLLFALGEAVEAAMRARASRPGDRITVSIGLAAGEVHLAVHSPRTGWLPPQPDQPPGSPTGASAVALGFTLMRRLVDQVAVTRSDEGTTVTLTKRVRPP